MNYRVLFFFVWFLAPSIVEAKPERLPRVVETIESEATKIAVERLAEGLGIPWGFDFLSPEILIITSREGKMHLLSLKDYKTQAVRGVPQVHARSQGGLLDVHRHPEFAKNRLIYFTYSAPVQGGSTTRLARARLEGAELQNVEVLFTAEKATDKNVHYGSRIAIDSEGYLYFSVGDRGERDRAQNLGDHAGKILRLTLDGKVPADNPFVKTKGARPEIWSYGHRNPQGLTFHPQTGELWGQEHGPRGGDEINLIKKGLNYGWPVVTFGREYWGPRIGEGNHKEGMEAPVLHWTPSIAPSGMSFYHGDAFPKWRGNLFNGSMVLTHLNRVVFDGPKPVRQERLLERWKERVRNVKTGPDGYLYFTVDSGRLYRLRPASSS